MTTKAKELEVMEQGNFFSEFCKVDETGMTFLKEPTFEQFQDEVIKPLIKMNLKGLWLLGDAMVKGQAIFGDKVYQVIDPTQYDPKTIMNAERVCKIIPPQDRHLELTFSHHETVASLHEKDRNEGLRKAAKEKMKVKDLRVWAREKKEAYPENANKIKKVKKERTTATKEKAKLMTEKLTGPDALFAANQALDYLNHVENVKALPEKEKEQWDKVLHPFYKIRRKMMGLN